MPEEINKSMETFPQKDIEKLNIEVERLKKTPEFQNASPRDVIKESIKQAFPTEVNYGGVRTPTTDHDEDKLLPDYMKTEGDDIKDIVEHLIHIALTEGIGKSIKEARKYGSFVLDALHDALVDKVTPTLREQGVI